MITRSDSRRVRAAQGITAAQVVVDEAARAEAAARALQEQEARVIQYWNARYRLTKLRGYRGFGLLPILFIVAGVEAPWFAEPAP